MHSRLFNFVPNVNDKLKFIIIGLLTSFFFWIFTGPNTVYFLSCNDKLHLRCYFTSHLTFLVCIIQVFWRTQTRLDPFMFIQINPTITLQYLDGFRYYYLNTLNTHLGFCNNSPMAHDNDVLVTFEELKNKPYPWLSIILPFLGWSKQNGMPNIGTPLRTDCEMLWKPQCVINKTHLLWAKKTTTTIYSIQFKINPSITMLKYI